MVIYLGIFLLWGTKPRRMGCECLSLRVAIVKVLGGGGGTGCFRYWLFWGFSLHIKLAEIHRGTWLSHCSLQSWVCTMWLPCCLWGCGRFSHRSPPALRGSFSSGFWLPVLILVGVCLRQASFSKGRLPRAYATSCGCCENDCFSILIGTWEERSVNKFSIYHLRGTVLSA